MQIIFTSHFQLDWKPLKTECVLHMVGCGTKQAGHHLKDPLSNEQRREVELQNTSATHLVESTGTSYRATNTSMVDGLGGLECELQARLGAANRVFQPLAKLLMSAQYLNCETKVQLFRSLVLSVLLYECETWPEPTPSQERRLEEFQIRCLRRIGGSTKSPDTWTRKDQ